MKNFIAIKIQSRQKIHAEFKKIIREARAVLMENKQKIDEAEKKGESFQSIVERFYEPLEKIQARLLKETDRIADNFTDEEHLAHKDFVRDHLGPLFWQAPLNEWALLKPLGYAGDYEMMNMLYDPDPFKGPSAYFKIINAFVCRCVSGQATAARIPYFMEKFKTIGTEALKRNPTFRILNLACGPSKEIQQYILNDPISGQSEFYLVDQDPQAIQFSKNILEKTKQNQTSTVRLFYYDRPIQEFLANDVAQLPLFDFIYSCGLFDYLDDTAFEVAVSILYSRLAEKGTLVIGNLSPDDYSKTLKWYLDDWPLLYRTKEELLKFAPSSPKPSRAAIEAEKTGVNLFLVVEK